MPVIQVNRHRTQPGYQWTYALLDAHQRVAAQGVRQGRRGTLFMAELVPVITLGRQPCTEDLLLSPEKLSTMGIEIYKADRGGRATYHGPGQWVLFPVDTLEALTGDTRGVRRAIEGLLESARDVVSRYVDHVEIRDGDEMGVWTKRGKIASVGVHIEDRVLLHGLSVNGYRTPASFLGLKPCGLDAQADYVFPEADEKSFVKLGDELLEAVLKHLWQAVERPQGMAQGTPLTAASSNVINLRS